MLATPARPGNADIVALFGLRRFDAAFVFFFFFSFFPKKKRRQTAAVQKRGKAAVARALRLASTIVVKLLKSLLYYETDAAAAAYPQALDGVIASAGGVPLALPMFAITLFVSAFILFLVQPIIGKMILPSLGGTPQVWNTCMVFFQAVLLLGYSYTHTVSTRFPLRKQLLIHGILLFLPLIVLLPTPFNIQASFKPPPGSNPIPYTLGYLFLVVGLPFFVVSTSAPLLQKWFGATGHPASKDPYFLYGASNLGSMLALLAYPFAVEPFFFLRTQAMIWTVGYGLLLLLVLLCVYLIWSSPLSLKEAFAGITPPEPEPALGNPEPANIGGSGGGGGSMATAIKKAPKFQTKALAEPQTKFSDEITSWRRTRWVLLGAVPSSLMLGITTHITTDLSPIPLFWLVPLSLYLLSFILVFSRWPVVWTDKPHSFMLLAHPVVLAMMIFIDFSVLPVDSLSTLIFFLVLGFFWTAMVCHGELARDRPSTRHLTEFYLWMSVGGVVGGIFNGLAAPVLFKDVWEFPIALCLAGLVRPWMKESGWTDDFITSFTAGAPPQQPTKKGQKHQPQKQIVKTDENSSLHYLLDAVLPLGILILVGVLAFVYFPASTLRRLEGTRKGLSYFYVYGIPLAIACFYYGRPVRFGLALGAVLLVHSLTNESRNTLYATRSYFGVIKVSESEDDRGKFTQLTHGTTLHGQNYRRPADKKKWGDPLQDFSRLATTYYHVQGPVGRAMDRFNWFKDRENLYRSDARMPVSLIGMGASLGSNLPAAQLLDLWSEPPYATIGLGTGTMASYARPYQHAHFYEIDDVIRSLSLPVGGLQNYFTVEGFQKHKRVPYFNYLQEALGRGASVQVLMGDARQRMNQKYENYYKDSQSLEIGGGPVSFYHLMVVDAFSSDAIPVHLLTKQAVEMYFQHLVPEGILCVHTSNRHLKLVKVVADVADSITMKDLSGNDAKLVCRVGHDQLDAPEKSTSEWVMVARDVRVLDRLEVPRNYQQDVVEALRKKQPGIDIRPEDIEYWRTPDVSIGGRYVWTDDYSNLISVLNIR